MRIRIALSLGFVIVSTLVAEDLKTKVRFGDVTKETPLFVPEEYLAQHELRELIARDAILRLESDKLNRRILLVEPPQLPGSDLKGCSIDSRWKPGDTKSQFAKTIVELLIEMPDSFVGRVTSVVPGFDLRASGRVARMVYVEVETVLPGAGRTVVQGDTLGLLVSGGRMRVGKGWLCTSVAEFEIQPEPGDRVLVAGARSEADRDFGGSPFLYRVDGDAVRVTPNPLVVEDAESISLSEILRALETRLLPSISG